MKHSIVPLVKRVRFGQEGSDFKYWQSRPYAERIAALEMIRSEYHTWQALQNAGKQDAQSGFQRVYRIVKR